VFRHAAGSPFTVSISNTLTIPPSATPGAGVFSLGDAPTNPEITPLTGALVLIGR
jgi:hypothetical protein